MCERSRVPRLCVLGAVWRGSSVSQIAPNKTFTCGSGRVMSEME